MTRNRIQWSEQEQMMAGAYANIAASFSQITAYMKNHLRTVQNGGGIITEGDMEEIFQQLSDMINKNLHNASQMRVKITTENVASKKITTKNTNSSWVSTASNGSPVQFESKQPQKIRISESELKQIISESVKNVLKERTKNEMGLSDDEVSRNRTIRFANIVDPEYCDSIYDDEQENYMNRMNARRKQHHLATQKHKSNMENSYDW